jgi:predicted RNA binding protein YcfA (HicA-like mRNA interferase family)
VSDRHRKAWERIAQRVNATTFQELRQLLELAGWRLERVSGSHHIFAKGADRVNIPLHRPHVKAPYVKMVLEKTWLDLESPESPEGSKG